MSDNNEAGKQLHQLLDEDWSFFMKEHPEAATHVGFPGQDDRWTDESLEGIQRRKARSKRSLQVLEGIQRAGLSAVDQLNYGFALFSMIVSAAALLALLRTPTR